MHVRTMAADWEPLNPFPAKIIAIAAMAAAVGCRRARVAPRSRIPAGRQVSIAAARARWGGPHA